MRRMRNHKQFHLVKLGLIVLALFTVTLAGIIAAITTDDHFLAQTLAYADEPAPAATVQTVKPVEVSSGVHFAMSDIYWEGNIAWVNLSDGRRAKLTLKKDLQDAIDAKMHEHALPYAGTVAIDPKTGRVLAIASANTVKPAVQDYALRVQAPSASVFKLVTSAALLEKGAIDPYANVCYPPGGDGGLLDSHIIGTGDLSLCHNLEFAIAHSTNQILARLAYQHLTREDLEAIALKFGFNREIPLEVPVDVSTTDFPEDDIERARAAAGFWHVNLSPFNGALITAAIINDGVIMRPTLVDAVYDAQGNNVYTFQPSPWLVAMSAENAQMLAKLSEATPREGTASGVFSNRKGWKKGIRVGGKTGTLSNKKPFYTFNWYVGWAQYQDEKLAVGAVIANTDKWWYKGTHLAAKAIGTYFHE